MVDILFLAEIIWCTVWMRAKGLRRVLLYSGGIVSAGYVSTVISSWFATSFVSPSSQAFLWVQTHITTDAEAVSALSRFVPPMPTWAGLNQTQWIALHIIKGILFVGITGAIFVVFLIVDYLVEALWDRRQLMDVYANTWVTTCIGAGCGVYIVALTYLALGDLAWLKNFPVLSHSLHNSIFYRYTQ